jgi:hypothetical protein
MSFRLRKVIDNDPFRDKEVRGLCSIMTMIVLIRFFTRSLIDLEEQSFESTMMGE